MDKIVEVRRLLESGRWVDFLESTARGLGLNLTVLFPTTTTNIETRSTCPECQSCFTTLTRADTAAAMELAYNGPASGEFLTNGGHIAVAMPLKDDLCMVVRACSCAEEQNGLSVYDRALIAQSILTDFQAALSEGFSGGQRAIELSALRQINHITLSLFRGEAEAMNRAFDLVLSSLVILMDTRGSWLEYDYEGIPVRLIKGDMEAVKHYLEHKTGPAMEVEVRNGNIRGRLGVLAPDDRDHAMSLLPFMAQECAIVFEVEHLYKLLQARLAMVLGVMGNAILLLDRRGYISFANKSAENLLGRRLIRLIGYPAANVPGPWTPFLKTGTVRRVSGQMDPLDIGVGSRWVDWQLNPLLDDGGIAGWVVTVEDRTDYHNMQESARQAERLATTATMVGALAHELRNPLSAAKGLLQLMGRWQDPEKSRGYLTLVQRELDRVIRLLNEFMLLGRNNADLDPEPLDLAALLRELTPLLEGEAVETRVEVCTDLEPVPPVAADPGQLTQVVLNLVRNAVEASGYRGRVTISLRRWEDVVSLAIRDSGPGLPPEVAEKLFRPFFTTKHGGTGLGLATAQAIIYNHRGQISAANAPDGGAEFTVRLPINSNGGGPRPVDVLITVAEEMVRLPSEQALRTTGLKVVSAASLTEALHLAEHFVPSVLFLEQSALAGDNLGQLRQVWPEVKLLVLGDAGRLEDLLLLDAVQFIPRPLDYARLINRVRSMS